MPFAYNFLIAYLLYIFIIIFYPYIIYLYILPVSVSMLARFKCADRIWESWPPRHRPRRPQGPSPLSPRPCTL